MKKAIVGLVVSMFMLGSLPALAATNGSTQQTYDNTLKQLISLLLQEISSLEQQLAQQKANQSSTPSAVNNTTTSSNTNLNTSSGQNASLYGSVDTVFQNLDFDVYREDPSKYAASNISVIGMLDNNFLPSNGISANYVEMENPADISQPKIEIEIDNNSDYTAAVSGLQPSSSSAVVFIKVYGTGTTPQQFTTSNGSYEYFPVLIANRIDRCTNGYLQTTILTGSKLSDIFTCNSWKTIFSKLGTSN